MIKIVVALTIGVLATGCAQMQDGVRRAYTSPAELAIEDCNKMGFVKGSPQFQNCVLSTSQNIRNARAQVSAAEASRPNPINYAPTIITCTGTGAIRTCTSN